MLWLCMRDSLKERENLRDTSEREGWEKERLFLEGKDLRMRYIFKKKKKKKDNLYYI